jgi:hypothetical protein
MDGPAGEMRQLDDARAGMTVPDPDALGGQSTVTAPLYEATDATKHLYPWGTDGHRREQRNHPSPEQGSG